MRKFYAFFVLELKRFLAAKNILILLLFMVLCLYFVMEGIHDYKNILATKPTFQETESIKVEQFVYPRQYGEHGFRLLFFPSPLSIFFTNSGAAAELNSRVDSGERLNIYNSFKGKNLFSEKKGNFKDFSGIILLFGSLLVLYFGYSSFRYRDYLKFLSGFTNFRRVFSSLLISRILLLMFFFILLIGVGVVLLIFNGIQVASSEYVHLGKYLFFTLFVLLFFFLLGTVTSCLKSKAAGVVIIIALWFISVFLMPGVINKLVSKRSESITKNYKLELEKLKVLMDFEKLFKEKVGTIGLGQEKISEEAKILIKDYVDNQLIDMEKIENRMIEEMDDNVKFYQKLSSFFPSTLFVSVNNEYSSYGYKNFIDFYRFTQTLKNKFIRYIVDISYFNRSPIISSFLKGDENIFYAKSRHPDYLYNGISLTIILIILFLFVSYFCYKRSLFGMIKFDASALMKQLPQSGKLNLQIRKGESYVLLSAIGGIGEQLFLVYSGAVREIKNIRNLEQIKEKIKILADGEKDNEFVYIGKTSEWPPNIRVKDFLDLLRRLAGIDQTKAYEISILLGIDTLKKKYFGSMQESEKRKAIFAAAKMKKSEYYIFDDFASGMPVEFIIEFIRNIRKLKESGIGILYLSNDVLLAPEIGDRIGIMKGGQLLFDVKDSELRQMNLNQVYFQYFANGE